jgi:hypothetical protein
MAKPSIYRVRFFELCDCKLRQQGDSKPLAAWQMKKDRLSLWIIIAAKEHVTEHRTYPVSYRVTKQGETVREGNIDWTRPMYPYLTTEVISTDH